MEESKPTIRRLMRGRRFLASTVVVPPSVAEHLNTDALAVLAVIRNEAQTTGKCTLPVARIAERANIGRAKARAAIPAVEAAKRTGKPVVPEVMVPLIATKAELDLVKASIDATAEAVARETGTKVAYQVGTMIELPRASLRAAEIAETAEFFSFGTNDLTQTAFGISRDDAASFLGTYMTRGILASDPFVSIDREGVGELVRIGVERGRKTKAKLKVGICGEHGGDPASVAFCHEIALDYVSCSPFRVPIARLAAAQAALGKGPTGEA